MGRLGATGDSENHLINGHHVSHHQLARRLVLSLSSSSNSVTLDLWLHRECSLYGVGFRLNTKSVSWNFPTTTGLPPGISLIAMTRFLLLIATSLFLLQVLGLWPRSKCWSPATPANLIRRCRFDRECRPTGGRTLRDKAPQRYTSRAEGRACRLPNAARPSRQKVRPVLNSCGRILRMTVSELLLLRILLLNLAKLTCFGNGCNHSRSLSFNTFEMTSVADLILWYMQSIYKDRDTPVLSAGFRMTFLWEYYGLIHTEPKVRY